MNWTSIAQKFLGNVFEHEKVKEFKEEFIGATVDWIKPLFLEEIPEEEVENASEEKVDASIQNLLTKEEFQQELKKFIQSSREKNILDNNIIEVGTDANIGDKGIDDQQGGKKNIATSNKMKIGGGFNLGDSK